MYKTKVDPRMYPSAKVSEDASVRIYTAATTGDIDLSKYAIIKLAASGATTLTAHSPVVGQTYVFQQDSTGTNNHAVTLTGCTLNAAGNNVLTTNADDETLVLLCISATEFAIISNIGAVALS